MRFIAGKFVAGFAFTALVAVGSVKADPWVIDFDDVNGSLSGGTISHGQIIDREYRDQIPGAADGVGVSISAISRHGSHSFAGPAVAFDTMRTGTEDSDLQQNTSNRTGFHTNSSYPAASTGYGNILIVQEKDWADGTDEGNAPGKSWRKKEYYKSCNSTECLSPDDSGDGGDLKFSFTQTVRLIGLNLFDIEETGGMIKFFDREEDGSYELSSMIDIPVVGADTVGFLGFGEGGEGVLADKMIVWFAGSGGVDNITGDVITTGGGETPGEQVPEPGALALLLVGLTAFGWTRRDQLAFLTARAKQKT